MDQMPHLVTLVKVYEIKILEIMQGFFESEPIGSGVQGSSI